MTPFCYAASGAPAEYACGKCGASGVKLWRASHAPYDDLELRCARCALEEAECGHGVSELDEWGRHVCHPAVPTDRIGGLVPAVPTEDGGTFWGYTSVPAAGCVWWWRLPLVPAPRALTITRSERRVWNRAVQLAARRVLSSAASLSGEPGQVLMVAVLPTEEELREAAEQEARP